MRDAAVPQQRQTPDGRVRAHVVAALRDPASLTALAPGELDFTLRVLRRSRLLARIAWQLREQGLLERLPRQAQDALVGALATTEARARLARWELDRLAWALADLPDLPLVAMKGCAYLLAGTPNARGRLFADVDLLVPELRLTEIERQLSAHGWRAAELSPYDDNYYRLWTHELPPLTHAEREVEVDLHHNLVMRTSRFRSDPASLLAAARPVPGTRFQVLAPVDMTLHAIAHLLAGGELDDALRELVDIDNLLRHFGEQMPGFWQAFWPRARQLNLARPAFYGLRYAQLLLGTPVPEALRVAAREAAPGRTVLALMDRLVPRALLPQHPDQHSRRTDLARLLLFIRSHWLRMPPLMLMRHLSYKFYLRHLRRVPPPASNVPQLTDK